MFFSKEHLSGVYEWEQDMGKSVFNGNPSRRPFNRSNGPQVLFIINHFLNSTGNSSIDIGQKIERLIIDKLPFNTSSELTVFNWLKEQMANTV